MGAGIGNERNCWGGGARERRTIKDDMVKGKGEGDASNFCAGGRGDAGESRTRKDSGGRCRIYGEEGT